MGGRGKGAQNYDAGLLDVGQRPVTSRVKSTENKKTIDNSWRSHMSPNVQQSMILQVDIGARPNRGYVTRPPLTAVTYHVT